ncbi:MAG: hypothetical protein IJU40_07800 [Desulfovibrionaceae bacterium]|nr:hypothetical protein [Desulfovibrionaceae bacterium]
MDDNDFTSRLMYCCACLEAVLEVNQSLPTWMFTKFGNISPFDIPSMPAICFPGEIKLPEDLNTPFTVTLAFFSRDCIHPFLTLVKYRLDHPYKVLNEFDEILYTESADILSDILYEWFDEMKHVKRSDIYELYNNAVKDNYFRNASLSLLKIYYEILENETSNYFKNFCIKKMQKRLSEFWLGYSINFGQGIKGTSKFRLIFTTNRGKEIMTGSLLYSDYPTFSDKSLYERDIRNLFLGIFPPTKYPESKSAKGFNVFDGK